jgi:hypothetical protein
MMRWTVYTTDIAAQIDTYNVLATVWTDTSGPQGEGTVVGSFNTPAEASASARRLQRDYDRLRKAMADGR